METMLFAETTDVGKSATVVESLAELKALAPRAVIAIGVFDGVHCGHQEIFHQLVAMARERHAVPVAMFFEPHPRMVLQPERAPLRICNSEERIRLILELGIQLFVRFPFTRELAALSPKEFYERHLRDSGIDVCGYCVGENWRFGHGNSGDANDLKLLSGVDVLVVPSVLYGGLPVSSTRIRKALADGDMALTTEMLGRPYCISGIVGHGQGKGGAELAYPTANLPDGGIQLPKFGVYAAYGIVDGIRHDGIVYVGDAPTLRGGTVLVEFHAFDFSGDIYGHELTVEFVEFLRPSIKFGSSESLKQQIDEDILQARKSLEISNNRIR
ncbi:MAG: riboflavin biosynthesis protein RibF [Victivallales bacterium]|nr:riboflavin biosynthesis protein RibF [Victivallales bacterium]